MLQIETLKAENAHLRQAHALQLAGGPGARQADGHVRLDPDLPLSLNAALDPGRTDTAPAASCSESGWPRRSAPNW